MRKGEMGAQKVAQERFVQCRQIADGILFDVALVHLLCNRTLKIGGKNQPKLIGNSLLVVLGSILILSDAFQKSTFLRKRYIFTYQDNSSKRC
jgi:hypothetical protein